MLQCLRLLHSSSIGLKLPLFVVSLPENPTQWLCFSISFPLPRGDFHELSRPPLLLCPSFVAFSSCLPRSYLQYPLTPHLCLLFLFACTRMCRSSSWPWLGSASPRSTVVDLFARGIPSCQYSFAHWKTVVFPRPPWFASICTNMGLVRVSILPPLYTWFHPSRYEPLYRGHLLRVVSLILNIPNLTGSIHLHPKIMCSLVSTSLHIGHPGLTSIPCLVKLCLIAMAFAPNRHV